MDIPLWQLGDGIELDNEQVPWSCRQAEPLVSEQCATSLAKQLTLALVGASPESIGTLTDEVKRRMPAGDLALSVAALAAMLGFLRAYMERWGQASCLPDMSGCFQ
jgi:hypothetical protein